MDFWSACLETFARELPAQQFNTWIKPLRFEMADDEVRLFAPNRFVLDWVREKYLSRLEQLAEEHFGKTVYFTLTVVNNVSANSKTANPSVADAPIIRTSINRLNSSDVETTRLNPSFTFDTFVSGKANQMARAAAIQVAEHPGTAYNPLFIYGGVGLGKTHLVQAIGNFLYRQNSDFKVRYIHAEQYVSDVVRAYQHKAFNQFKQYYHSLDLLLVDDIQFFSGKNRTQEEFFYAFNALIEAKKQVIITCDTFPKEISGIEERLISRFGWGLTVAVEPPELEMRVAILLKKAEQEQVELDENVAFFIAKHIRSNVRELEGGLKRVAAFARFTNNPISIELAKDALKDLLAVQNRMISIENIQKTVADYYKIKVADLYSQRRSRSVARPRQMAMALAKELTQMSLPDIGESFGGRDHTTVLHACRKIVELRGGDHDINRDYNFLLQVLKN